MEKYKRLLLLVFMTLFCFIEYGVCQDRIIKVDGTLAEGSILKISESTVEYKLPGDKGPVFELSLKNIHKIILESGDAIEYNPLRERVTSSEVPDRKEDESINLKSPKQTSGKDDAIRENRARTTLDYSINLDVNNSQTFDDGVGNSTYFIFSELMSFKTMTRIGSFENGSSYLSEHGFVTNLNLRFNTLGISETYYFADFGAGYGLYYNSFSFYSTLNTTVWYHASTTILDETVNESAFFPSNTGYFRIGMYWKPMLKKSLRESGDRSTFGLHIALNSFFAGGSAILVGFGF